MNRLAVVAGFLGLGLGLSAAGCASGRSAMPGGPPGPAPVGLSAVPPIHETINGRDGRVSGRSAPPSPPASTPEPTTTVVPEPTTTVVPEPTTTVVPEPTATVVPEPTATVVPEPAQASPPPPADAAEPAGIEAPPMPAPPEPAPTTETVSVEEPAPPVDPEVEQTAAESTGSAYEARSIAKIGRGQPATRVMARVGDSFITYRELIAAVKERAPSDPRWQKATPDQKYQIIGEVLDSLIDRLMLVQAARKELHDPKKWETFSGAVEQEWREKELPALVLRYKAKDEYDLERKLAELGESLADKHEAFQLDTISRYYIGMKLHDKIERPYWRDLVMFYGENQKLFEREAQVTWREISIPIDDKTDRESALRAAEAARARLLRGEDFGAVARQVSRSPKAEQGGLWEKTGYDSFACDAVNQELKRLAPGQLSPVLEDERGFYLVRVEAHSPAGPAPFPEVQKNIEELLMNRATDKELKIFLDELRRNTFIKNELLAEEEAPRPKPSKKSRSKPAR